MRAENCMNTLSVLDFGTILPGCEEQHIVQLLVHSQLFHGSYQPCLDDAAQEQKQENCRSLSRRNL